MLKEFDNRKPTMQKHAVLLSEKMIHLYDFMDHLIDKVSVVLVASILLLLTYYLLHVPGLAQLVSDYVKN